MRSIAGLSLALVAIVASCGVQAAPVSDDPGAWLAKELGLENVKSAADALDRLKQPAVSPVQSASIAASKVGAGEASMADMEAKISELLAKVQSSKSPEVATELGRLVYSKITALRSSGRYVEALVENQRLKQVCLNLGGCPPTLAAQVISFLEGEMALGGDRAVLGLSVSPSTADIKRARRSLTLLLHPDKNVDLDAEGQAYLKDLFVKVQRAYENLTKN